MPRWGMVIDLDKCSACRACVIACKAENNVPISSPQEAQANRVISWLSVLSVEEESGKDQVGSRRSELMPLLCLQCDHPPCVKVCPVGATYKDRDGLVAQVYYRCIGCRYCTNNCPYTVKYFNWHTPEWPEELEACMNPDVTVRVKGVVEKCTFCNHRLQEARDLARSEGRPLREGDYEPACVEVCPAKAMYFGDLDDPNSTVVELSHRPRALRLLEDLGTEPKVVFLSREV
jgi:Fe-S-cluster-containing dehydrogenase component